MKTECDTTVSFRIIRITLFCSSNLNKTEGIRLESTRELNPHESLPLLLHAGKQCNILTLVYDL